MRNRHHAHRFSGRAKKTSLIAADASSVDCCFVAAYEQLRGAVLEDVPLSAGGHFGLVILLREGVATWMAHLSAQPRAPLQASPKEWALPAPIIANDVLADMVAVLANMVLSVASENYA